MAAKKETKLVEIPALKEETIRLRLRGLPETPLVCCPFDEKAKESIRDKQAGKAKSKQSAKDTDGEFERHRYRMDDGRDGFPNILIRHAIVDACSFASGVTKVHARGCIYVNLGRGRLTPIYGADDVVYSDEHKPTKREDRVMVNGMAGRGSGSADLRYRPEYMPWSLVVDITYDSMFTTAQVVNLVRLAGRRIGLGEWRSQKGGQWGMFDVETIEGKMAEAAE